MEEVLLSVLFAIIGFVFLILILSKPYLGVVFTVVSLPVVDLLPTVPYLTSFVVLLGIVTFAGFILQKLNHCGQRLFHFGSIHILGLLFVAWLFISNFQAAWFGTSRNWALTFVQLWVLVWLAGELFDSSEKQHIFMWIFSIACGIAAIIAIGQGQIGNTISASVRAIGLAGNPNSTGRYLIVAMIFFGYLKNVTEKRLLRLLAVIGMVITFVGVFFTLSRSSILLLMGTIGLQYILGRRRKISASLIITYLIAALLMWFLSDQIINILKSILPSILQGADTVGVRYKLWQAAWQMWLDHRLQGVGIGMYSTYLPRYALNLPPHYWSEPAHNAYLTALAETGIIGFLLFSLMFVVALKNFWHAGKVEDIETISLRNAWLIVFLVVLMGEFTANGLYDKLLWFLFGISIYFHKQFSLSPQENAIPKQLHRGSVALLERY